MEYHPLSDFFPMLAPEDFDELVEDMRKHGQLEPIVVHEGKILDGRNRYEACETIGIEAKYRELDKGIEPLDYVVAANLKRRHLRPEQKLDVLDRVYGSHDGGGRKSASTEALSKAQMAGVAGTSTATVDRFRSASRHSDLRSKMVAGDMTAKQADREYRRRIQKRQAEPEDKWRWTPEVVHIVDWLKNYQAKLKAFRESEEAGKLSPEAGRFIAERVKQVVDEYVAWAIYLEEKYHA